MSDNDNRDSDNLSGGKAASPVAGGSLSRQLRKARVYESIFGVGLQAVTIGRFTLLEHIGSGGMGEVYAAYDEHLDRKVAIKLVRSGLGTSARADERLLREAQTLAQLSHPNVIQIYDAGTYQDRVFIAMEFVRGTTLEKWLDARESGQVTAREILRLFIGAGRGLEAAHNADLVHRDFKPANVLVEQDGRPRVADFGLARAMASAEQESDSARDSSELLSPLSNDLAGQSPGRAAAEPELSTTADTLSMESDLSSAPAQALKAAVNLTTRGHILGTPRYMAPEQLYGHIADSRSDQFSFCVALYEALYRTLPFVGDTVEQLRQSIEQSHIAEPPRGSAIPNTVRKTLLRGLEPDPERRFATMGQLLDALEQAMRRGHRALWTLALVAGVSLAAVGALYDRSDESTDPCIGATWALDADHGQPWTSERRAAIRSAFDHVRLPYAAATWRTVDSQLDQYDRTWQRDVVQACRDTRVHHVQSPGLLDRRMICLRTARQGFVALTIELQKPDSRAVERAVAGTVDLPKLAACSDIETLRYGPAPPDEEFAEQVATIRRGLARVRTLALLGRFDETLSLAREQRVAAGKLPYRAVYAEALTALGRLLIYYGNRSQVQEGEDLLLEARDIAIGERHDELVPEIWNLLVVSAWRNHPATDRGREWSRQALASIRRLRDPPRHRIEALRQQGLLYYKDGRFALAAQLQHQALAALDSQPDASSFIRAAHLHDLANTLLRLNQLDEAHERYQRALDLYSATVGPDHPYLADVCFDLAMLYVARGQLDEARDMLDQVLHRQRRQLGPEHSVVGRTLLELAEIERRQGHLDRAHQLAMRGLQIYQREYSKDHSKRAFAHTRLGAIAYDRGDHAQALAEYEKVLAIERANKPGDHIDIGYIQANIAEVATGLGRHDKASASLDVAQSILGKDPVLMAFLRSVRGRIMLGQGRVADAVNELETAEKGFGQIPEGSMPGNRANLYWALARAITARDGRAGRRACDLATKAVGIFERQGPSARGAASAVQSWLRSSCNSN